MTPGFPQPSLFAPGAIRSLLCVSLGTVSLWAGPRLDDIVLRLSGRAQAEMRFAAQPGPSEFPSFFQKTDSARKTVLLSFLETETTLPLGAVSVPPGAPLVQSIEIKRLRSPSGRVFLGIEFGLKSLPKSEWEPKPHGSSALRVELGMVPKKGSLAEWSLAKALASPPPAPVAEPSATPSEPRPEPANAATPEEKKKATPIKIQPPPSEVVQPSPAAEPAPAPTEAPAVKTPAPKAVESAPKTLTEIKISSSSSGFEVALLFKGDAPAYTLEKTPGNIAAVALKLRGATADSASAKFDVGRGGIRSLRWKRSDLDLAVVLILDAPLIPMASVKKNRLILTFPGTNGKPSFNWSSRNPAPPPKPVPEPALSAHEEGLALEKQAAKRVSSSVIFTTAGAGKSMVVTRDSSRLSGKPAKAPKTARALLAGETVRRLGSQGGFVRVLAGSDTGYLPSANLAYADELKPEQSKAIAAAIKAREEVSAHAAAQPPEAVPQPPSEPAPATEPTPPASEGKKPVAGKPAPAQPPVATSQTATPAEPVAVEPPPAPGSKVRTPKGKTPDPKLSMPASGDTPKLALSPQALEAERQAADSEIMDLTPKSERVAYNSFGRRDPFVPVDQGSLDNGIDIDQMKVVGIVWESDPMAVLEHVRDANLSFTVRQGDPVHNGRVSRITRENVTFDLTEFGISRSYTLRLVPTQERAGK